MRGRLSSSGSPRPARRVHVKSSAATATSLTSAGLLRSLVTPVYGQQQAPSPGSVVGANNRITVGYIGVGLMGRSHIWSQQENAAANNVTQAAVCDVSKNQIAAAQAAIFEKQGSHVQGYDDHRRLLERKDIDAVTISTVDHWHAQCAIDALDAGRHVYVDSPFTRYLPEAWEVAEAVKRTGKILQVGVDGCSDGRWKKAAELIRTGAIGQLVLAQDSYMRNGGDVKCCYPVRPWATREDVNWDRWQGNVKTRTWFDPDLFYYWPRYSRYCAGTFGLMATFRVSPLLLAAGAAEYPMRVACVGTTNVRGDPNVPVCDYPEQTELIAEFPGGLNLQIVCGLINQVGVISMIRGQKATLSMAAADKVELKPEPPFEKEVRAEVFKDLSPSGEKVEEMEKNWFGCIRSGKPPIANIDLALKAQTVLSLAEMSERLNIVCLYDEKTRKITTGDGTEVAPLTYGSLPPPLS